MDRKKYLEERAMDRMLRASGQQSSLEGLLSFTSDGVSRAFDILPNILPEADPLLKTMGMLSLSKDPVVRGATSAAQAYPRTAAVVSDLANIGTAMMGVQPAKRALGVVRDPENRGMFASSFNVKKEGHYNPDQIEMSDTTGQALEGVAGFVKNLPTYANVAMGNAARIDPFNPRVKQETASKIQNLYKSLKGQTKWTMDGLVRIGQQMFDPKARAMYTNYGITPVFDELYTKYGEAVAAGNTQQARSVAKELHQQMQQMANIKHQAGQLPKKADGTASFILAASDPDAPAPFFSLKNRGEGWFYNTTGNSKASQGATKKDADIVEQHVMDAWKIDPNKTSVVIKTPRSDLTGNHFTDILANQPSVTAVSNLFLGGTKSNPSFKPFDSAEDLAKAMTEANLKHTTYQVGKDKGKAKKDSQGKNVENLFNIKMVDEDTGAVWFTIPGLVGKTSMVEGGVNALIKVDKKGNLLGVMSDKHDFYETLPFGSIANKLHLNDPLPRAVFGYNKIENMANKPMEAALPQNVIAVSPMMTTNVVSVGGVSKFGKDAEFFLGVKHDVSTPLNERAREAPGRARIEEAAQLKDKLTAREIGAEVIPVAQNYAGAGLLLGNPTEEQ